MLYKILVLVVPLLICVAYFTLVERKILASINRRRGPNVIGVYGILQPFSDGFKLFVKEPVTPSSSNKNIFVFSPIHFFIISIMGWVIIPFDKHAVLADMHVGIMYLFAISSLNVYGIILSGWASNSKYAALGALRSTSQMISYEVSIGFVILTITSCAGSFSLADIIFAQRYASYIFAFSPLFYIFFMSTLAETSRHPYDLPESEAELVSGYNVEYSAMVFALFSLGEYSNMLLMGALNTVLFFGGWNSLLPNTKTIELICYIINSIFSVIGVTTKSIFCSTEQILDINTALGFFTVLTCYAIIHLSGLHDYKLLDKQYISDKFISNLINSIDNFIDAYCFLALPSSFWFALKINLFVLLFVYARATLPRYRYDQLMNIGWKVFLPVSIGYLIFTWFILVVFNMLPF